MLIVIASLFTIAVCAAPARAESQRQIERQIRAAFAPYGQAEAAVCIARRESGLNPRAYFAGNYGLLQINWASHRYFDRRRLLTTRYNLAAAVRIYRDARRRWGNGWLPWSTRGLCGA